MTMQLSDAQHNAAAWMAENSGLLIATPGTGKTRTTLGMLDEKGWRALIIAPASVARRTWQDEQRLVGGRGVYEWRPKKKAIEAFSEPPHVIVSYESAQKYLAQFDPKRVDTIIFDEVTRLRNPKGKRFQAIRAVLTATQRNHRVGLTGTPAANHLHQLYGQLQITAGLPMIYEQWLGWYFIPQRRGGRYREYTVWFDGPDTLAQVGEWMDERSWVIPDARDQDRRVIDHWVDAEMDLRDPGMDAEMIKAHQLAQGRLFTDASQQKSNEIHTAKRDRLVELLEDLQGQPVLIFHQFTHDLIAIEYALQKANVPEARVSRNQKMLAETIQLWNDRKLNALVVHPQSAGHGLNLQRGGHQIIWYGVPWDWEVYEQGIGRLDRQGQDYTVMVHRILTEKSVDEAIVRLLDEKRKRSDELKNTGVRYYYGNPEQS